MNTPSESIIILMAAALGVSLTLLAVIGYLYKSQLQKVRAQAKEMDILRQELSFHKAQQGDLEMQERKYLLNPHLFKNTLNAIQSYAYKTHLALERLGDVLDYILYDSRVSFTSLEKELEFLTSFIELNKFRLNPLFEFSTSFTIDKNSHWYLQKIILPLITVDFIENAFRHGDLNSSKGFITVNMQLEQDELVYMVSNRLNPQPLNSRIKGGIGQNTLRRRLEMKYPDCYELIYTAESDTYTAYLKLNLHAVKNKMHSTG